jgi:glucose dehydrogenase
VKSQISKLFTLFCMLSAGVLSISAVKATAKQSGAASSGALAQAKQNWPLRGGSLGQTYFSELSSINVQNVQSLGAVWISEKFADAATSRVTPIVNDGVMFYTAGARVYAVNAASGKPVWTYLTAVVAGRVQVTAGGANGAGVPNNQGVVVADGLVYVGLMNAHAIAVDEKTGKLVWDRDLSDYLPKPKRWIAAAPTYANGVLYWSITNNERWMGRAIALDGKTGHELWHFDVIPGPGQPGHET